MQKFVVVAVVVAAVVVVASVVVAVVSLEIEWVYVWMRSMIFANDVCSSRC